MSQLQWDNNFLDMARDWALKRSKDPSTKVGAVLTRKNRIVSIGYNGFPRGVEDRPERYANRELKNKIVVHAEENCLCIAAEQGNSTAGTTMYVAACNAEGSEAWGGPPCHRCTVSCIQAGVVEFVARPRKLVPSRWHESMELALDLIHEAGLKYREIPFPEYFEVWCTPHAELQCPEEHVARCTDCPLNK